MSADQYSYRVRFSEEEQQFVGTCLEFPSLSHIEDSAEAALQGIEQLVGGVLSELEKTGETPPARAPKKYHWWADIKRSKGAPEGEERVQQLADQLLASEIDLIPERARDLLRGSEFQPDLEETGNQLSEQVNDSSLWPKS